MAAKKKVITTSDGVELDYEFLQKLGRQMKDQFATYKRDRRQQEKQWLKNLYQFLGKYDPEIEANLPPERSRAYPKITRTKLMTIVARLMNLLFPQGDKSWAIQPSKVPNLSQDELDFAFDEWLASNPDGEVTEEELDMVVREFARKAAQELELHIEDQLSDSMGGATETDSDDFVALCRQVIISAAIYNVGVLKGPMTVEYEYSRPVVVPGARPKIETYSGFRPYFEFVPVWDYYPDMQAKTFTQMDGQFEDHVYAKHHLQALARREDYLGEQIKTYLRENPDGNYEPANHEQDLDTLNERREVVQRSNKYRVTEWWGSVSTKLLKDIGVSFGDPGELPEDQREDIVEDAFDEEPQKKEPEPDDGSVTRAVVWFIDDVVIKVEIDPLPQHAAVYHQFVFDDSVPALCGGSMAEVMRDSQMAVSSTARMMIDNASVTCGPNLEIDMSKLVDGQDYKTIGPFRNYYTDSKNNPSGHRAINSISFDSHLNELLQVQSQFMNFADVETFVSQENMPENTPGEALRTSGGASMIMGNAALPFRDIVRSFDKFTVSVINSMVAWNKLFNEELSMMGDMRPVAKGATSLIAKEVRAFQLDNLSNTLTEEERIYLDDEKILKQKLQARDIPFEDIKASEQEVERRKEERARRAEQMRRREEEAWDMEKRAMRGELLKDLAQGKKNLDSADATSVQALSKLMETGANIDERAKQPETGADA